MLQQGSINLDNLILLIYIVAGLFQIHSSLGMLYIKAFYGIFAFCFGLVLTSYTTILTNNRIIGIFLFDILKRTQVLYSEIKEIELKRRKIYIYQNDKCVFPLVNRKESRICFEKLKKLLESENLNIKIS